MRIYPVPLTFWLTYGKGGVSPGVFASRGDRGILVPDGYRFCKIGYREVRLNGHFKIVYNIEPRLVLNYGGGTWNPTVGTDKPLSASSFLNMITAQQWEYEFDMPITSLLMSGLMLYCEDIESVNGWICLVRNGVGGYVPHINYSTELLRLNQWSIAGSLQQRPDESITSELHMAGQRVAYLPSGFETANYGGNRVANPTMGFDFQDQRAFAVSGSDPDTDLMEIREQRIGFDFLVPRVLRWMIQYSFLGAGVIEDWRMFANKQEFLEGPSVFRPLPISWGELVPYTSKIELEVYCDFKLKQGSNEWYPVRTEPYILRKYEVTLDLDYLIQLKLFKEEKDE